MPDRLLWTARALQVGFGAASCPRYVAQSVVVREAGFVAESLHGSAGFEELQVN